MILAPKRACPIWQRSEGELNSERVVYTRQTASPLRQSFLLFAVMVAFATSSNARPTRPRFEPTDLELEQPGVAELDVQIGVSRGTGSSGNRLILPDFEFDVGLLANAELDIDGAFSIDRFDQRTRAFAGEALWLAMKLGLFDTRDSDHGTGVAGGLQLGPRAPTIDARGIGYGALGLVGVATGPAHLAFNFGGIIDPGREITSGQTKGLVAGVDLELDTDARGAWSVISEVATAHYLSDDPDELTATFGTSFAATEVFDISAIALVGLLPGQDRLAVILGVTPKFSLW